MFGNTLPFPTFSVGTNTATGGTAFASLVPPSPGGGIAPILYGADANHRANWAQGPAASRAHVTCLLYTTGTTAHKVAILRPFNWTTLAAAAAGGQKVVNLADDPGVYSTNYKYPTPGNVAPSQVGDNGIAASDYVAYQVADGTWVLDTVNSVSSLAVTLTTNLPTGGALAGAALFFFGAVSDKDPATGQVNWQTTTTASTNRQSLVPDNIAGGVQALHPGDPLVFYSPNGTAAGTLDHLSGFYARH